MHIVHIHICNQGVTRAEQVTQSRNVTGRDLLVSLKTFQHSSEELLLYYTGEQLQSRANIGMFFKKMYFSATELLPKVWGGSTSAERDKNTSRPWGSLGGHTGIFCIKYPIRHHGETGSRILRLFIELKKIENKENSVFSFVLTVSCMLTWLWKINTI